MTINVLHGRFTIMKTRGEKSRERIIAVTQKLLARSNPDKVSLDLISLKCNLSKSSILWHFHSKEELFLAVVTKTFEDFVSHFAGTYDNLSPIEKLDRFFIEYAAFAKDKPESNIIILTFLLQKKNNKKIQAKLRELFSFFRTTFLENLGIPENEESKYFVSFIIAALDGFFLQWLLDPEEIEINKSYQYLKKYIIDIISQGKIDLSRIK